MTRSHPDHLRTSTRVKAVAIVYVLTLAMALVGVRLAAPLVEEWLLPVIDPRTDRVLDVHMNGTDLCWDSVFDKVRPGKPIGVRWNLSLSDRDGVTAQFLGVTARRVDGRLAPMAPFVNLTPGERHTVSWCLTLPTTDFSEVRITADWEYRTHRWWTVHQSRAPIVFRQ